MRINVRTRIALAMTLVLGINVAAAAVSWYLSGEASRASEAALVATARATWVSQAQGRITAFVSETSDLALGVSAGSSSEGSSEYGDLLGADTGATRLFEHPSGELSVSEMDEARDAWETLRLSAFSWVNAEAQGHDSPLRLTLMNGDVRASVDSNIALPEPLSRMNADQMRAEVRRQAEALGSGILRRVGEEATAEAVAAQVSASQARQRATSVTFALVGLSALVALLAGVWLYRTIAGPLREAQEVADRVAKGELEATFAKHGDDEIGTLIGAVEQMRDSVVGRISIMREMAGAVLVTSDGLHDVATRAKAMGNGNEELTGALEQVDASSQLLTVLASQMIDA